MAIVAGVISTLPTSASYPLKSLARLRSGRRALGEGCERFQNDQFARGDRRGEDIRARRRQLLLAVLQFA